jgi:hypothetical protein
MQQQTSYRGMHTLCLEPHLFVRTGTTPSVPASDPACSGAGTVNGQASVPGRLKLALETPTTIRGRRHNGMALRASDAPDHNQHTRWRVLLCVAAVLSAERANLPETAPKDPGPT